MGLSSMDGAEDRSPEELPPEAVQKLEAAADAAIERLRDPPTGRGLLFPPFNLGKTWSGSEDALTRFNDAVDELADTFPDVTDRYTTVRGNQLRIEDYRPYQAGPSQQDRSPQTRGDDRRYRKVTPRHQSYQESQQDQQDPDRRSY